jgi:hypothetical protein
MLQTPSFLPLVFNLWVLNNNLDSIVSENSVLALTNGEHLNGVNIYLLSSYIGAFVVELNL